MAENEMSPEEFARSKLRASDRRVFDAMLAKRKRARDSEGEAARYRDKSSEDPEGGENNRQGDNQEPQDLEGASGNALDEIRGVRKMNSHTVARIAADEYHAIRQAEIDVKPFVGALPIAFDSASAIYAHALEHLGVSRSDIRGLGVAGMRVLLKSMQRPGARSSGRTPAMAHDDSGAASSLDFLKDIGPAPRDISTRSDYR